MQQIGVGTDIVNINRIGQVLRKYPERFLAKYFHQLEIERYYNLRLNNLDRATSYIAKRFAAKEAIVKAFGGGISGVVKYSDQALSFKDIAIINEVNGQPTVKLFNRIFNQYQISISLSDEPPFAIAFVIITNYS